MKVWFTGSALAATAAMLAGTAAAQPLPAQKYPYKSGPVTITSCTLNENKSNSTVTPNSLRINYFPNVEGHKLTSITFRVSYAGTPITLTDTGDFEYNAPISHQFNQLGGHAWAGASPGICRVVTATFDDGRVVNPMYDGPDGMGGPSAPGAMTPAMPPQPEVPPPTPGAVPPPVVPQPAAS